MNASKENRAFVLFLLLALFGPVLTLAQDGKRSDPLQWAVPPGERVKPRQGPVKLSGCAILGVVTDQNQALMPGVEMTAVNLRKRVSRMDHTDTRGGVVFARLPPGKYLVQAIAEGFSTARTEVTVALGHPTIVSLQLEKEDRTGSVVTIPEGEKRRAAKVLPTATGSRAAMGASPASELRASSNLTAANQVSAERRSLSTDVDVIEMALDSETSLQEWLNGRAQEGRRLLAIVPVKDGTSLFVLAREGNPLRSPSLVLPFSGLLSGAELSTRIRLHPDKSLVGVHQLGDKSFLIVFEYSSSVRTR